MEKGASENGISAENKIKEMKVNLALRNYEIYSKLPKGSATLNQVIATSGGIDQFSKWTPPVNYDGYDEIVQMKYEL